MGFPRPDIEHHIIVRAHNMCTIYYIQRKVPNFPNDTALILNCLISIILIIFLDETRVSDPNDITDSLRESLFHIFNMMNAVHRVHLT